MSDLISRADAIEAVLTYFIPRSHTGERGEHEENFVITIFKALPSADDVQGKWIWCGDKGDSRFMCSICKSKENVPTCMGEPSVWDYCPNCGARMKGGAE